MIAPNTQIILCKGVNIDRGYQHTLRANDKLDQYNKIVKYKKRVFEKNTYQRANEGTLRVQALADDLYDCNYMIFQNTSFGNKYFYAFIDSVNYVNENCCEVHYTIDVMQTWFFDFTVKDCFVDREHSATDNQGENVIPEDLGSGDLTVEQIQNVNFDNDYTIVTFYDPQNGKKDNPIFMKWDTDVTGKSFPEFRGFKNDDGAIYANKTLSACMVAGYHVDTPDNTRLAISTLITSLLDRGCKIVSMIQMPTKVFDACINDYERQDLIDSDSFFKQTVSITQRKDFKYKNKASGSYTPRNNKLYQYPYRQLMITNNAGQTATFKWEDFKYNGSAKFEVQGAVLPAAELALIPTEYRNLSKDYASAVSLTNFVDIAWSEDSFAKWWNQNKSGIAFGMLSTAISTGLQIATAGVGVPTAAVGETVTKAAMSKGGSALTSTLETLGTIANARNTPDQIYGQLTTSAIRLYNNKLGYTLYDIGTDGETAETIDNYFTMFGYATKRVKVPNVFTSNRRPHFNFLKTNGVVLTSSGLNAADEESICGILNRGITFWESLEEVGDYSVDNSVSSVTPTPTPTPVKKYKVPFTGITSFKVTQGYTSRTATAGHQGYDLVGLKDGSAVNITVASIGAGTVTFAGAGTGSYASYGNYVEITDNDGLRWHYAHLASVKVNKGDKVSAGTALGIMGRTGTATGVHLHLDIRGTDNYYINPYEFTLIPNKAPAYYEI